MADIQGNYRVTYLDGREETTTVSVGNRIQAEIQARRGKWGNLQESAYRQLSYSVWHSLKRDHKTELEFNDWTFTVDDIEKTTPTRNRRRSRGNIRAPLLGAGKPERTVRGPLRTLRWHSRMVARPGVRGGLGHRGTTA